MAADHPIDASGLVRLSKRMSELGLASRREADAWIESGRVLVNGRPAVLGQKVGSADKITVAASAKAEQGERGSCGTS